MFILTESDNIKRRNQGAGGVQEGCGAACRGEDQSRQAGQCRLQSVISSNWSSWSKTKAKVET